MACNGPLGAWPLLPPSTQVAVSHRVLPGDPILGPAGSRLCGLGCTPTPLGDSGKAQGPPL